MFIQLSQAVNQCLLKLRESKTQAVASFRIQAMVNTPHKDYCIRFPGGTFNLFPLTGCQFGLRALPFHTHGSITLIFLIDKTQTKHYAFLQIKTGGNRPFSLTRMGNGDRSTSPFIIVDISNTATRRKPKCVFPVYWWNKFHLKTGFTKLVRLNGSIGRFHFPHEVYGLFRTGKYGLLAVPHKILCCETCTIRRHFGRQRTKIAQFV